MTEKPRETQAESHVVELKEKVNNSSLMKHQVVAFDALGIEGRWCMNRNWPATNPTHRSITYQERTTMAYRARPSG